MCVCVSVCVREQSRHFLLVHPDLFELGCFLDVDLLFEVALLYSIKLGCARGGGWFRSTHAIHKRPLPGPHNP